MNTSLVLAAGGSTAHIHPELGGRLGQLDFGDGPLLRGSEADAGWDQWGCYPLLPWSNRLPGGRLHYGDIDAALPINHPDGSAIHGLAASCAWNVDRLDDHSVSVSVVVSAGPYEVLGHLGYDLSPTSLGVLLRATNLGEASVPVGIGLHPWFTSGPVRVPADLVWPGEPLPIGPPAPVSGDHDLRARQVPALMDACFTGLRDAAVEVPGARLSWDGPVTQVVVYSGEPGWVCVEPVTMANDGFNLAQRGVDGHGVCDLGPGEGIEVRYRFERAPG